MYANKHQQNMNQKPMKIDQKARTISEKSIKITGRPKKIKEHII